MNRVIAILMCTAAALAARAGFDGYPLTDTATNYLTWGSMAESLDEHPFEQLVNALNERLPLCNVSSIEITNRLAMGTNGVEEYTTLTNTWGWFAYTHTVMGVVTGWAQTYSADWATLDKAIYDACNSGKWVCTNEAVDGSLDSWFEDYDEGSPPFESLAGACERLNVGFVTNQTSVSNFVTGGDAWLWRRPQTDEPWVLTEFLMTGDYGGWVLRDPLQGVDPSHNVAFYWFFRRYDDNATFGDHGNVLRHYGEVFDTNLFPEVQYVGDFPTGGVFTFLFTGLVWTVTNYSGNNTRIATESVTMTTNTASLTQVWFQVWDVTNTSANAYPTGAVVQIAYDDDWSMYRDPSDTTYRNVYHHWLASYDERWRLIRNLLWTWETAYTYAASNMITTIVSTGLTSEIEAALDAHCAVATNWAAFPGCPNDQPFLLWCVAGTNDPAGQYRGILGSTNVWESAVSNVPVSTAMVHGVGYYLRSRDPSLVASFWWDGWDVSPISDSGYDGHRYFLYATGGVQTATVRISERVSDRNPFAVTDMLWSVVSNTPSLSYYGVELYDPRCLYKWDETGGLEYR